MIASLFLIERAGATESVVHFASQMCNKTALDSARQYMHINLTGDNVRVYLKKMGSEHPYLNIPDHFYISATIFRTLTRNDQAVDTDGA